MNAPSPPGFKPEVPLHPLAPRPSVPQSHKVISQPYANGLSEGEVQIPKPFNPDLNRIVCSANRYKDGTVIPGVRHFDTVMHNVIAKLKIGLSKKREDHDEGFLDKFGKFHNREDAWKIAFSASQILRRCGGDDRGEGRLYSENLY